MANDADIRALTRAVANLNQTMHQLVQISKAVNENLVELGRMKKAENE